MIVDELSLTIDDAFVADAQTLFDRLASEVVWDERMRARKTASFGEPYNYSGISYPFQQMPESLLSLIAAIEARFGYRPNNCLVNFYENGYATMGFHSDATEHLAENTGIIIISLGAERTICFRHKQHKTVQREFRLKNGSLLFMSQNLQKHWKHAILPQPSVTVGRISLTFRLIR